VTGPRPFYAAAALFIAAGAALRLAPVRGPEALDAAPVAAAAAPGPRRTPPPDTQRYRTIVAMNAFSAARTAPATRFLPEGLRRDTVPVARTARKPAEVPARLFGITRGPGGAVALIEADPTVPGAEVYQVGDEVRGGRITAIGDSTVVLSRPSGRIVLRLPDAGARR
jgi:hypothetical protein